MSTESRERERVSFQEVAKLAAVPEPSSGSTEEKKENSGMIDLAALAAGETSPSSNPRKATEAALPLPATPPEIKSAPRGEAPPQWIPTPVPTAPWLPNVGASDSPVSASHAP